MNEDEYEYDFVDTLFEHLFPCATGHEKLIDKYYSNMNSTYWKPV